MWRKENGTGLSVAEPLLFAGAEQLLVAGALCAFR